MKQKLALIAVLCMFAVAVNAQSFGVKAGLSFPSQTVKGGSTSIDLNSYTGFHAGVVAELPIAGNLYVNTGLLYAQKGNKQDVPVLEDDAITKLNYLELPVNLAYKIGVGPLSVFPQAGVYFDYALNGQYILGDTKVDIDFDEDDLKQIDFGLNVGVGVQVSIIQVSANYSFGMVNLYDFDEEEYVDDLTMKNGVFSISAALLF